MCPSSGSRYGYGCGDVRGAAAAAWEHMGGSLAFDVLGGSRQKRGMSILASIALTLSGPVAVADGGRPACTRVRATRVSVEAVRADPDAWQGRCVTLVGLVLGSRLYADRAALADRPRGAWGEETARSIPLYQGRRLSLRRAAWRAVTGTVGSCVRAQEAVEALRQADPDSFIMVGGFCHTSLEPYLSPTRIDPLPGQVRR